MKGYAHAVSGTALWAAVATPEATGPVAVLNPFSFHFFHVTWPVYFIGLLLCAGAALLPDMDHPQGTIAWSLPPFTKWLAEGVAACSGGHRHGTHSWLGIAFFTVLAWVAGLLNIPIAGHSVAVGAGLYAWLLMAFTFKVFHVGKGTFQRWAQSGLVAALISFYFPAQWSALPLIVAVGCFAHVLGDTLTTGGCVWTWPLIIKPPKWVKKVPILHRVWQSNGWISFPILGDTDGRTEKGHRENKFTRQKLLTYAMIAYWVVLAADAGFVYSGFKL